MKVCIAEKPSVAREIAQVLGADVRKDGYMEGNGYQVTWTFGHLCTLKEPDDYFQQWKYWSFSSLPMIPPRFGIKLIDNQSYEKQFNIIKELFLKAEMIINCGDAGQEGELIQRWVLQKTGARCPVKRLWISSLTEDAIREGFSHLRDQSDFDRLYEAGLSRAIGDWILGMNATRLFTLRYGQKRQVLSIGRVQTPTLAMIVRRQQEIDNFVPEPFWEVKTTYRDVVFSSVKGKFQNRGEADKILESLGESLFTVEDVTEKKGKEYAPKLFDLTSLQVECNRKYSFSADVTLKLIQSLYEKKMTTYPRVDTVYLSEDIHAKIPAILGGLKGYEEYTAPLKGKKIPKSKRIFDNSKVTDHHAIIPTGFSSSSMTDDEKKVYDLVVRRFIAGFYPDCEISTTTVLGKAAEIGFKVTGKQILKSGWRTVLFPEKNDVAGSMSDDDAQAEDNQGVLPSFEKGESGHHTPFVKEGCTTPPKPYTEATLLRAMETAGKFVDNDDLRDALKENGIGRPSTRAAIIETLYNRNFVKKVKKNLLPTSLGTELVGVIDNELLKSAELTGLWERKLRMIEKGEYHAKVFIDELKNMVSSLVRDVLSDNSDRRVMDH